MRLPKVSILVPVYGVEQFIERCARSLFEQTFQEIEFIFIDDATIDNSIKILENVLNEYPNRKKQSHIIHHLENKGLAAARNTAKKAANGEYIINIDSDDYVEKNMIELLYNKAKDEDADIVYCNYWQESAKGTIYENNIETTSNPFDDIVNERIDACIFNKLIRKTLYNNSECFVPEGLNYTEDYYVSIRLFFFAKRISKVNQGLYHYTLNRQLSISSQERTKMHFENLIQYWKEQEQFFKKYNLLKQYQNLIEYKKIRGKVIQMMNCKDFSLLIQYKKLYHKIELKQLEKFKRGEWLMLFCAHYNLIGLMLLHHFYIWHIYPIKQKIIGRHK